MMWVWEHTVIYGFLIYMPISTLFLDKREMYLLKTLLYIVMLMTIGFFDFGITPYLITEILLLRIFEISCVTDYFKRVNTVVLPKQKWKIVRVDENKDN